MYEKGDDCFYYITMYNEEYAMPAMRKVRRRGFCGGFTSSARRVACLQMLARQRCSCSGVDRS